MDLFDSILGELIPAGAALKLLTNLTLTGLCIVPATLVVLFPLRSASAATRHLVLSLAFVAMLVAPVLSILLPARERPELVASNSDNMDRRVRPSEESEFGASDDGERQPTRAQPPSETNVEPLMPQPLTPEQLTPERLDREQIDSGSRSESSGAANADRRKHDDIEPASTVWFDGATRRRAESLVAAVWCAGVVLLGLRVLVGQFVLWRVLRTGRAFRHATGIGIVRTALSSIGLERPVALIQSDRCRMPMTCGLWRPAVVLPKEARGWSADRLRMVLLHELAHVRRRDCVWQWIVFVVTAIHWFNPLVWLAAARLRREQEQACDDAVLNRGVRASDYARTLLEFGMGGRLAPYGLCNGIAMARSRRLSTRVRAIVDPRRDRRAVSPRVGVLACLVATGLVVPLSQFTGAVQPPPSQAPRDEAGGGPGSPAAGDSDRSAGDQDGKTSSRENPDERNPDERNPDERNPNERNPNERNPNERNPNERNPDERNPDGSNPDGSVLITLPGGHMLDGSAEREALVEAALALLGSTGAEGRATGYRDESVGILFSPPREIRSTFGGQGPSQPPTVRISRLYIDLRDPLGPGDIVTQVDGGFRSFTRHDPHKWVAFRRELDRITFGRPRPIVPAVGQWSKPVDGLQARLAVENWRDPMIGVFLELRNVKDLVNTMVVPLDANDIDFELRNEDGELIPDAGLPRSGPVVELKDLRLPFDSSLRFNLSVSTVGVSVGDNAMIALRSHAWRIPAGDFSPRALSASFAVEQDAERRNEHAVWHGRLRVPPVMIRPARRERPPDRNVSRRYDTAEKKRDSVVSALNSMFEEEEDVSISADGAPAGIRVTAAESRQGFISDLIDALGDDDPGNAATPDATATRIEDDGDIARIGRKLAEALPEWRLHEFDAKPRAFADGYQGHRIVLRRTWREYTGPAQQRAEPTAEGWGDGPFEGRYEDWEFVLVPTGQMKAPQRFVAQVKWLPSTSPYHTRDIYLGEGLGHAWFTRGSIPLQFWVREKLGLQGGDDPIQLLADGLLIEDKGTNTANSSAAMMARYGDRALPYIEKAIEEARRTGVDPWKAIAGLARIQTPMATDILIRLYESGDDALKRPAAYALIHVPFRRSAKSVYLAMLRERMSVERVTRACVEFEWTEAIPILQDLTDRPSNLREYQYALHARRALEGRPIAEELLEAEQTLRGSTRPPADPERQLEIDAARRLLVESADSEAANLAALSLAAYVNKADVSRVRDLGLQILKLRPRQETLAFLRRLAASLRDEGDQGRIGTVIGEVGKD